MKMYTRLLALAISLCFLLIAGTGCDGGAGQGETTTTAGTTTTGGEADTTTTTADTSDATDASGTGGDGTVATTTVRNTTTTTSSTVSGNKDLFDKRTGVASQVIAFIPWDTSGDATFQEIKSGFEKEYNTELKVIPGEWGTRDIKLTQMIRAGNSPDYVSTCTEDFPRRAIKSLLQPLDDLIQESDKLDSYIMENITVWQGKKYAIIGKRNPGILYYNTTMLKNAMITDTPAELAAANKWTWNDLKTMARKLTVDNNRDGKPDVYGFGTELDFIFPLAMNTDIVKIQNGTPVLNIDDENWRSALLFYYDGVNKDKIFTPVRWSVWEEFANGNVAMYYGVSGDVEKILNKGMKNWDIAPFPKADASSTEYVGHISSDGFGVAPGAANPVGGIAFGEYQYNYYTKKSQSGQSKSLFTEEQQAMIESLSTRYTQLYGYGMEDSFCQAFGNYMRKNGDFTALMEEMRPIWQKNLDDTLKGR